MNNLAYNDVIPYPSSLYKCKEGKGAVGIERKKTEIILTVKQEEEFARAYKIGIIKQLQKKGLITDKQVNLLIEMQNK